VKEYVEEGRKRMPNEDDENEEEFEYGNTEKTKWVNLETDG
jgi:hypothetical protein